MVDDKKNTTAVVLTRPGIGSAEAQRAAAAASEAMRVKAEPGNQVMLSTYRAARFAAHFLAKTLGRAPWVDCIHAGYAADGRPVIVIMAERPLSVMERSCNPTSVNHFDVEVRVGRCRRNHTEGRP